MENTIKLYDGKAYGVEVSKYGLEYGYLDYRALDNIIGGSILNNTIRQETPGEWEIMNGESNSEIFQDYIIDYDGYKFLEEHTDEIVLYNDRINLYLWCITHFGTSWDYVLTDIEIKKGD